MHVFINEPHNDFIFLLIINPLLLLNYKKNLLEFKEMDFQIRS
jgi:hypothetical protein